MTDERQAESGPESGRDTTSLADGTLGGYLSHHSRPPAFEGMDGSAYTVSLEVEKTGDLRAPFSGYLVFPRWADTGAGIVGHLESPTLTSGRSEEEEKEALAALTLHEVNRILAEAIVRRNQETD